MRAVSATDAISPAIQRTWELLFSPFQWGTYLKLGLVAIITEGAGAHFNSSSHTPPSSGHTPIGNLSMSPTAWIAVMAAIALALLLCFFVLYLVTRLRFAFFHCLISNTRQLRPGWRLYQTQATRFFWLNVAVGCCFLLLVGLAALPFVHGFWQLFQEIQAGGHPPIGLWLSLILPLIPLMLVLGLVAVAADVILRDWMLPHYALEDASAGEAWASVWARIVAEKRQFIAYALLRLVLPTIAMVAVFMLLVVPGLMLAGSVAAIEYGLHSTFADATGASSVIGILLQVFFGLLALAFAVFASICVGGPVSTAIREYALVFYAGRYQVLGDILFPVAPPVPPVLNSPGVA
jgi:hypothetical protein